MGTVNSYRDLEVWKRSIDLSIDIYRLTQSFPADERFGLISQIRRATTSIPANIAEGWGRRTTKDYVHFLIIARGSLAEVETHLILSYRLDFIDEPTQNQYLDETGEIGKMLNGLIRSLQRKM